MSLIHYYDQADIHRQVCVAILDSFLPHGDKTKFSKDVGITAQWFSYIREKKSLSMPSTETAKLMAKHLPAPDYYKESLYDHICEARAAYEKATKEVKWTNKPSEEIAIHAQELSAAHSQTLFTTGLPLTEVKRSLLKVMELGEALINNLNWKLAPLQYMRMMVPVIHTAYSVDKASSGLYWAILGLKIAEAYDIEVLNAADDRKELADLRYEFARNIATGYSNLNLPKEAMNAINYAEPLIPQFNREGYIADLNRNRSNILAKSIRFNISDAEYLTDECIEVYERRSHGLNILLSREAKARAYIAHGIGQKSNRSLRKAEKVLRDTYPLLDKIPMVGAMHRVIVTKTVAKLHKAQGNRLEHEKLTEQLLNMAREAGLYHQYRTIMQESGWDRLEEEV
jgi:hypothetical protein